MRIVNKKTINEVIMDALNEVWEESGKEGINKIDYIEVTQDEWEELVDIHNFSDLNPKFAGYMFMNGDFCKAIEITTEGDE